MFSLDLDCTPDTKDLLIADLWEHGSSGIVELSDSRIRAFFDDDAEAPALAKRFPSPITPADTRDWVAFAQDKLQPIEVGEKFFLVPIWRSDPTPPGRFRIEVNNGLAFGTGAHETTRLCIALLERFVRPGMTVFDIGTGSGILAQAAKHLGATLVIGCDNDATATAVSHRTGIPMFTGTATALASSRADIVVANISPEALQELSPEWDRLLKPGGIAILSGLELSDPVPVTIHETVTENEWKAIVHRAS